MKLHFLILFLTLGTMLPEHLHGLSCIKSHEPQPGAYRFSEYLNFLQDRKVGIVANHTSRVDGKMLSDTLLSLGIKVARLFSPEHGYLGKAADGTLIENSTTNSGIPVISLYGDHKKPGPEDLKGLDILIFDIQDVGCRFYTYISTLSLVMEACAENHLPLIVLDRPNPNGSYIDGPVLEPGFSSFVGMHPVPIVYGMTIGEYALMVNGERWLKNKVDCNLRVIPCKWYSHGSNYQLPVKPSPNLPTMNSVYLYPSLCLFEGTVVSVGRGTDKPFECIGHPSFVIGSYIFTPQSIPGVSDHPPLEGKTCYGHYLGDAAAHVKEKGELNLVWLIEMYKSLQLGDAFFTPYFDKLAGTDELRKQIMAGLSEEKIRESWQEGLSKFMKTRNKYLIYHDNQ